MLKYQCTHPPNNNFSKQLQWADFFSCTCSTANCLIQKCDLYLQPRLCSKYTTQNTKQHIKALVHNQFPAWSCTVSIFTNISSELIIYIDCLNKICWIATYLRFNYTNVAHRQKFEKYLPLNQKKLCPILVAEGGPGLSNSNVWRSSTSDHPVLLYFTLLLQFLQIYNNYDLVKWCSSQKDFQSRMVQILVLSVPEFLLLSLVLQIYPMENII